MCWNNFIIRLVWPVMLHVSILVFSCCSSFSGRPPKDSKLRHMFLSSFQKSPNILHIKWASYVLSGWYSFLYTPLFIPLLFIPLLFIPLLLTYIQKGTCISASALTSVNFIRIKIPDFFCQTKWNNISGFCIVAWYHE